MFRSSASSTLLKSISEGWSVISAGGYAPLASGLPSFSYLHSVQPRPEEPAARVSTQTSFAKNLRLARITGICLRRFEALRQEMPTSLGIRVPKHIGVTRYLPVVHRESSQSVRHVSSSPRRPALKSSTPACRRRSRKKAAARCTGRFSFVGAAYAGCVDIGARARSGISAAIKAHIMTNMISGNPCLATSLLKPTISRPAAPWASAPMTPIHAIQSAPSALTRGDNNEAAHQHAKYRIDDQRHHEVRGQNRS